MTLSVRRCLNHEDRQAAARCPRCQGFFCRECVSIFQRQLICAACLSEATEPIAKVKAQGLWLTAFLAVLGLILVWGVFYMAGSWLLLTREQLPPI